MQKLRPHNAQDVVNCQWTHGADRCPEPAQVWESGQRMRWCRHHDDCNTNDPARANVILRMLLAGERPAAGPDPEVARTAREALREAKAVLGVVSVRPGRGEAPRTALPVEPGADGAATAPMRRAALEQYRRSRTMFEQQGLPRQEAHERAIEAVALWAIS